MTDHMGPARARRAMRQASLITAVTIVGLSMVAGAQTAKHYALEMLDGLRPHNVTTVPATLGGRKGVRVNATDEIRRRMRAMTPEERDKATRASGGTAEHLVVIDGLEFGNGTIEAEVAGTVAPGVFEGARGFVGIAFRVQNDLRTYDAFYLRPTNGRADDQVRRNHSAQYIAHPDWTWSRLRTETPEKYESYVDLVPGEWTKVRIEVRGEKARLYVHGQAQPTLIVNDLKSGANGRGAIALWLEISTDAYYRNIVVTPEAGPVPPQ